MLKHLNLTAKMMLAISFVCLTVIAVNYSFFITILNKTALEADLLRAETIRSVIQNEIDDEIDHILGLSRFLNQNTSLRTAIKETVNSPDTGLIGQVLDTMFKVLNIDELKVIDANSMVIYDAKDPENINRMDKSKRIEEALAGKETLASDVNSSGIQINAMFPILKNKNTFSVLVLGFDIDEAFLKRVAADSKTRITVVSSKLQKLVSYPADGKPLVINTDVAATSLLEKSKIYTASDSNQLTTVYFAGELLDESVIWIIDMDSREANQAILSHQKKAMLFTGMMVGLAAIVLGFFARRHAFKLSVVEKKANKFVEQIIGSLNTQAIGKKNRDEIESLSDSVNLMAERLTFHVKKLEEARLELTSINNGLERTVQLRMEKILEGEVRFHTLVERLSYSILLCTEDKSIRFVNQATLNLFNYDNFEFIIGCKFSSLFVDQDQKNVSNTFHSLWNKPRQFAVLIAGIQTQNGRVRTVKITAVSYMEEGQIQVLAILDDITDLQRNELALQQANAELSNLSKMLLRMQEDERRRIARDLHDHVGQILTALKMSLQSISKHVLIQPENLLTPISLTEEVLNHTRNLTTSLHPHILEDLGLMASARWLVERYIQPLGILVSFNASLQLARADQAVELVAFRVIQESFTNIIRHAHAKNIELSIYVKNDRLHILVDDDGVGFDFRRSTQTTKKFASLGLVSMRERVSEVQGELTIDSEVGLGTQVHVILPWLSAEPIHKETV